jgi:hypothetical protein
MDGASTAMHPSFNRNHHIVVGDTYAFTCNSMDVGDTGAMIYLIFLFLSSIYYYYYYITFSIIFLIIMFARRTLASARTSVSADLKVADSAARALSTATRICRATNPTRRETISSLSAVLRAFQYSKVCVETSENVSLVLYFFSVGWFFVFRKSFHGPPARCDLTVRLLESNLFLPKVSTQTQCLTRV